MRLDRRQLLVWGAAAATLPVTSALLGACGSDSGGETGGESGSGADGQFVVIKRFPNTALTPGSVRMPVALARIDGTLITAGPATLTGRILDATGAEVTTFSTARHGTNMATPYWPITVELESAGFYTLTVDDAATGDDTFQVFEIVEVAVPAVGSALPGFATPTTDDARGVEPICTLSPPCPFHEVTLDEALASGKSVVYVIGTPAHCQFQTCGPGLEFMVALAPSYADRAVFVHTEVFTDDTATVIAPAVDALGLVYEPVVFITDPTGKVTDRIDVIWDQSELDEILSRRLN